MSEIKQCFTSRYPGGSIVEVDWSQLEVVILAVETQDSTLASELIDGLDLHCALTAEVYKTPYTEVYKAVKDGDMLWTARRKKMKSGRFAIQYGAGAKKIAEQTGFTEIEAEQFIKAYYARYRGIKDWNNRVRDYVTVSSKVTGIVDKDGQPVYKGQYVGPNGRRYVFTGTLNKWGKVSFPPTKLQNYPIQGLASDFVKMMRSKVIRELYKYTYKPDVVHINTVHDSIMFDCANKPSEDFLKETIDREYGKAKHYLAEMISSKRDVIVPFNYSFKSTESWS
jgi:DNA polymerase I-like protein with 3'-5' exonuclease and polymerase domains